MKLSTRYIPDGLLYNAPSPSTDDDGYFVALFQPNTIRRARTTSIPEATVKLACKLIILRMLVVVTSTIMKYLFVLGYTDEHNEKIESCNEKMHLIFKKWGKK